MSPIRPAQRDLREYRRFWKHGLEFLGSVEREVRVLETSQHVLICQRLHQRGSSTGCVADDSDGSTVRDGDSWSTKGPRNLRVGTEEDAGLDLSKWSD